MTTTAKLGSEVDKLAAIQKEIDAVDAQIKKLADKRDGIQKRYEAQETKIFEKFDKNDLEGASGKLVTVSVDRKVYGTISNPKSFYDYIFKNKRFDLLQRRVNNSVYLALSEEGKKSVPGMKPFTRIKLKLKKRKT